MKTIFKISLFVVLTAIMVYSCKKDRDENPTPSNPNNFITIPVTGTVVDEYGNPLSNVTVKAGSLSVTTDNAGIFYFPTATFSNSRFIISFEKAGYFTLYRSGVPKPGKPINLTVGMISEFNSTYAAQKTFSSTQTDSIELPDGSVIVFPANAFITQTGSAYTGNVTVKACYLDPTWEHYGMYTFGGDLYGKDLNNNDVMLNPFKGLNVVLQDQSGNNLQLDTINNVKATVKMKIPSSLVADAPSTVQTWVYATGQGVKREKGNASKIGDKYMGQVAHFSYWSCEKAYTGKATVWGYVRKVVNSDSIGISGVKVRVGRQLVVTDQDGKYEAIIPSSISNIVVVPVFGYTTFNPYTISNPLGDNESKRIDFVVNQSDAILLRGRVLTANNSPISNALVSAEWYSQTQQVVTVTTNSLGQFSLPIEANAYYITLTAKTADQYRTIYIYNPSDTIIDIIMPEIPGNNKLIVNGITIFDITGDPGQNGHIHSHIINNNTEISVEIIGSGMFEIRNDTSLQTIPLTNQQYTIPNQFSVTYSTQNVQYQPLTSGTITFTTINSTEGKLIEGDVTGTDTLNNSVIIHFSVPNLP